MCQVCGDKFSVREKIAQHNFAEQMRDFYGVPDKHVKDKTRKNYRKSLINRIEYQIQKLKDEQGVEQLQSLLQMSVFDLQSIEDRFESIMLDYYKEKLRELKVM